jgi:MFS family permease
VGATLITLGPLLDPILRDLDIPLAQGGLLSFGFFFGRVVGVLLLNFALARVPIKTIMVSCALVLTAVRRRLDCSESGCGHFRWRCDRPGGVIPNAISGVWWPHIHRGIERAMLNIGAYFAPGVGGPLVIGAVLELGATWRWVFIGEAIFGRSRPPADGHQSPMFLI